MSSDNTNRSMNRVKNIFSKSVAAHSGWLSVFFVVVFCFCVLAINDTSFARKHHHHKKHTVSHSQGSRQHRKYEWSRVGVLVRSREQGLLKVLQTEIGRINRGQAGKHSKKRVALSVFVDRGDPHATVKAVEKMKRQGVSVVLSSLGQQKNTPVFDRMKKAEMLLINIDKAGSQQVNQAVSVDKNQNPQEQMLAKLIKADQNKAVVALCANTKNGLEFCRRFKNALADQKVKLANTLVYSISRDRDGHDKIDGANAMTVALVKAVSGARQKYGADQVAVVLGSEAGAADLVNAARRYLFLAKIRWYASDEIRNDTVLLQDADVTRFAQQTGLSVAGSAVQARDGQYAYSEASKVLQNLCLFILEKPDTAVAPIRKHLVKSGLVDKGSHAQLIVKPGWRGEQEPSLVRWKLAQKDTAVFWQRFLETR